MVYAEFTLELSPALTLTIYLMKVEIIHMSDQVQRFLVTGGSRSITLEKNLLKKRGNWKILEASISPSTNTEAAAHAMLQIQNEIDTYMAKHF